MGSPGTRGRSTPQLYAARPTIASASRASMTDEMKRIKKTEGKSNILCSSPLPTAMTVPRRNPFTKTSTNTIDDNSNQTLCSRRSKQTFRSGNEQKANTRSSSSDWNYKQNTTFHHRPHSGQMSLEYDYAHVHHTVNNTYNDVIKASIIDEENRKERVRKESERGKLCQKVIQENNTNSFEGKESLHQANNNVRPLSAPIVPVSKLRYESIGKTEPSNADGLKDDNTVEDDLIDELQKTNIKDTDKDIRMNKIPKSVAEQNGTKPETVLQTRKTGTTEKQTTSLPKKDESKASASKPRRQAPVVIKYQNDNLEFYKNKMSSKPFPGSKIEEMLKWFGNYIELERNHRYIQWLFPIPGSCGKNIQAQPLQLHEAEEIKSTAVLRNRVVKAYKMMLDFYGMAMVSKETGEITRCPDKWKKRFEHLNKSSHNYLRITRIIRSLGEFGLDKFQRPWLEFMLREIFKYKTLSNIKPGSIIYWIDAVTVEDDHNAVIELYNKLSGVQLPEISDQPEEVDSESDDDDDIIFAGTDRQFDKPGTLACNLEN